MVHALAHVRAMRGGSQSHLIRASDGHHYVAKFLNNPQHPRVLVNEWLASAIGRAIGLSVPPFRAIHVSRELTERSPELVIRAAGGIRPTAPGLAFGSRLPTANPRDHVYDYLPEPGLERIENLGEFAGILLLDKWLCNCDCRQVIFCRAAPRSPLHAYFIDHGFMFNAGEWNFPDSPYRGVYQRNLVYRDLRDWSGFEPWLARIERFPPRRLRAIAASVPAEWLGPDGGLDDLVLRLVDRRGFLRTLVDNVRLSSRAPFANWGRPDPVQPPISEPQPTGEAA